MRERRVRRRTADTGKSVLEDAGSVDERVDAGVKEGDEANGTRGSTLSMNETVNLDETGGEHLGGVLKLGES
jgi:hypothetical protein